MNSFRGMRAKMRRTLLRVVAVLTFSVLAWEFLPVQMLVWDGQFNLIVRVESPESRLQSVTCEAFGQREQADVAVAYLLPPESKSWSTVADPFDGQPITVRVAVSGRLSLIGREIRRMQFRYLAVIAVLPNGHRMGKVVDIPDGRVCREVSVTFP
jgi:hypothetical protein